MFLTSAAATPSVSFAQEPEGSTSKNNLGQLWHRFPRAKRADNDHDTDASDSDNDSDTTTSDDESGTSDTSDDEVGSLFRSPARRELSKK